MPGKHYSLTERTRIAELVRSGHGATSIARQLPGRTAGGVQGQIVKLGLVDSKRSAAAKSRKDRQMTSQQHKQFREFLRDGIRRAPPIELARQWNEQAVRHRVGTVSIDMVDYWIGKMRIRLSPEEVATNAAYRQVTHLRNLRRAATARATFADRANEKKEELRRLKGEVLQRKRATECRDCPSCGESWPATPAFFRTKANPKTGKVYFEARGCVLCVNAVRRRISQLRANGYQPDAIRKMLKADERRRRNARAEKVVVLAKTLRAKQMKKSKTLPTRECLDCHELWPLRNEYWRPAENGSYPRFCRFCDSRYRREQQRAKADGRPTSPIRAARRALLEDFHELERKAKRRVLQERARQLLKRKKNTSTKICEHCQSLWPRTETYWLFEPNDGPRAGKLARAYCRCCSHDKDAARNRYRKRRSTESSRIA